MFKNNYAFLAVLAAVLVTGCRTAQPLAPVDLGSPGWTTLTGQAVWKRQPDFELAGDLLLAYRGDQSFLQFTKGHYPVVHARRAGSRWEVEFFSERRYAGRGRAPGRLAWLQVVEGAKSNSVARGWNWSNVDGRWKLENHGSGEIIEGFFE